MLDPTHPLQPILGRLRLYLAQNPPRDGEHAADQREYHVVLEDLENGLFDRLPEIVVKAVRVHGENLHPSLDPPLLDIAWYIRDGLEPVDRLIASFTVRLAHHHGEPAPPNIVFIDYEPPG